MAMNTFTKSYTSFSGVDITAVFDSVPIGNLQGISYSITREKSPLYSLGNADPRSFSRSFCGSTWKHVVKNVACTVKPKYIYIG